MGQGGQGGQALAPFGEISVYRHPHMVENDGNIGMSRSKRCRLFHLAGIDLQIEGQIVFRQQGVTAREGIVIEQIALRVGAFRIVVPVDDMADTAHIGMFGVRRQQSLDIRIIQRRESHYGIGFAAVISQGLQPFRLGQSIIAMRAGIDMDDLFDPIAACVGQIVIQRVVRSDRCDTAIRPIIGKGRRQPRIT